MRPHIIKFSDVDALAAQAEALNLGAWGAANRGNWNTILQEIRTAVMEALKFAPEYPYAASWPEQMICSGPWPIPTQILQAGDPYGTGKWWGLTQSIYGEYRRCAEIKAWSDVTFTLKAQVKSAGQYQETRDGNGDLVGQSFLCSTSHACAASGTIIIYGPNAVIASCAGFTYTEVADDTYEFTPDGPASLWSFSVTHDAMSGGVSKFGSLTLDYTGDASASTPTLATTSFRASAPDFWCRGWNDWMAGYITWYPDWGYASEADAMLRKFCWVAKTLPVAGVFYRDNGGPCTLNRLAPGWSLASAAAYPGAFRGPVQTTATASEDRDDLADMGKPNYQSQWPYPGYNDGYIAGVNVGDPVRLINYLRVSRGGVDDQHLPEMDIARASSAKTYDALASVGVGMWDGDALFSGIETITVAANKVWAGKEVALPVLDNKALVLDCNDGSLHLTACVVCGVILPQEMAPNTWNLSLSGGIGSWLFDDLAQALGVLRSLTVSTGTTDQDGPTTDS